MMGLPFVQQGKDLWSDLYSEGPCQGTRDISVTVALVFGNLVSTLADDLCES